MPDTEESVIALLTEMDADSVDLNAVAFTGIYTVPPGKKMIIDHLKPRELSGDAGNTVLTVGQSSDKDDFVGAQTLSNLSAASKSCKIQPVPNATPPAIIEYPAGAVVGIDVTTAAGAACTAIFDLFGKLSNA